jgi:hypothetical protein
VPHHAVLTEVRYPVFWGGINIILAIREMIDAAYRVSPNFQRAILVSGDSLPVIGLDRLEEILIDQAYEYIQLTELPNDPTLRGISVHEALKLTGPSHMAWRFQNYVFYDDELQNPFSRAEAMRKFGISENQTNYIVGSVHRFTGELLRHLPPRQEIYAKLFYGDCWWALTRAALDLIIDDIHASQHIEYFRYFQIPDEHFFHTILGNKTRALTSLGRKFLGPIVKRQKGDEAMGLDGFREAHEKHNALFARKYDPSRLPAVAMAIGNGRYFCDIIGPGR